MKIRKNSGMTWRASRKTTQTKTKNAVAPTTIQHVVFIPKPFIEQLSMMLT